MHAHSAHTSSRAESSRQRYSLVREGFPFAFGKFAPFEELVHPLLVTVGIKHTHTNTTNTQEEVSERGRGGGGEKEGGGGGGGRRRIRKERERGSGMKGRKRIGRRG